MPTDPPHPERPDLAAWRKRHGLRSSAAASPVPSGKRYTRKTKNDTQREQRHG